MRSASVVATRTRRAATVDRLPHRRAGLAAGDDLLPGRVEAGRPDEQGAVRRRRHVLDAREGVVGRERAQALAEDVELGALVGRHPVELDPQRGDQRARRSGRPAPVDEEGQPARQVGVLRRHGGDVAVGGVLEGVGGLGVDPAAAGGAGDGDRLARVKPAQPAKLRHGEPGPFSRGGRGLEADEGAHRLDGVGRHRRPPRSSRGRPLQARGAALAPDALPGDARGRPTGAGGELRG